MTIHLATTLVPALAAAPCEAATKGIEASYEGVHPEVGIEFAAPLKLLSYVIFRVLVSQTLPETGRFMRLSIVLLAIKSFEH